MGVVGGCVHLARYLEGSSLTTGINPFFTWLSDHEFVILDRRQAEGRILTLPCPDSGMDLETRPATSRALARAVTTIWSVVGFVTQPWMLYIFHHTLPGSSIVDGDVV